MPHPEKVGFVVEAEVIEEYFESQIEQNVEKAEHYRDKYEQVKMIDDRKLTDQPSDEQDKNRSNRESVDSHRYVADKISQSVAKEVK